MRWRSGVEEQKGVGGESGRTASLATVAGRVSATAARKCIGFRGRRCRDPVVKGRGKRESAAGAAAGGRFFYAFIFFCFGRGSAGLQESRRAATCAKNHFCSPPPPDRIYIHHGGHSLLTCARARCVYPLALAFTFTVSARCLCRCRCWSAAARLPRAGHRPVAGRLAQRHGHSQAHAHPGSLHPADP